MKRIVILLMVVVVAVMLAGCSSDKNDSGKDVTEDKPYVVIFENWDYKIIADKDTNVMYWMSHGSNNRGTLTLLVNPDGTPKVWQEAER